MAVHRQTFSIKTKGEVHVIDISDRVSKVVRDSGLREGIGCIFTPHTTCAIVANEFEPGLMETDLPAALERIVPKGSGRGHDHAGEANGHSHLRAAVLGPSLAFPFSDGRPALGTWQQIVFVELDTQPRTREVVVQLVGE